MVCMADFLTGRGLEAKQACKYLKSAASGPSFLSNIQNAALKQIIIEKVSFFIFLLETSNIFFLS